MIDDLLHEEELLEVDHNPNRGRLLLLLPALLHDGHGGLEDPHIDLDQPILEEVVDLIADLALSVFLGVLVLLLEAGSELVKLGVGGVLETPVLFDKFFLDLPYLFSFFLLLDPD